MSHTHSTLDNNCNDLKKQTLDRKKLGGRQKIRILGSFIDSFAKEQNITVVLEHIYTPLYHYSPSLLLSHSFIHSNPMIINPLSNLIKISTRMRSIWFHHQMSTSHITRPHGGQIRITLNVLTKIIDAMF